MAEVVILGGYGRIGRLCAQEIAEQSRARLLIAGRSIQKAESAALALGPRARAAYGNAGDPRTLARLLEGARVAVACCGDLSPAVLELAVDLRVAVIAVSTLAISPQRRGALAEKAWRAQVPVILHSGAIPGLPGVLAELLVRRFARLAQLRLASTGPWRETRTAARDAEQSAVGVRRVHRLQRFRFPAPVGTLAVRPARVADLEDFARGHCVERVVYLEPSPALARLRLQPRRPAFRLVAEARVRGGATPPDARIELSAADPLQPAAALTGSLVAALLAGEVPAGLLVPREARNPAALIADLEKRGIGVRAL
jgi:hypothetical protein